MSLKKIGGVHAVAAHRLQGDLGHQVRAQAGVQHRDAGAHLPVLRQRAAGLAHEPHRGVADGLTARGAQEVAVVARRCGARPARCRCGAGRAPRWSFSAADGPRSAAGFRLSVTLSCTASLLSSVTLRWSHVHRGARCPGLAVRGPFPTGRRHGASAAARGVAVPAPRMPGVAPRAVRHVAEPRRPSVPARLPSGLRHGGVRFTHGTQPRGRPAGVRGSRRRAVGGVAAGRDRTRRAAGPGEPRPLHARRRRRRGRPAARRTWPPAAWCCCTAPAGTRSGAARGGVVVLVEADLEAEIAEDPLLAEVAWSWLMDALAEHGAAVHRRERHGLPVLLARLRRPVRPPGDDRRGGPRVLDAGARARGRHRLRRAPAGVVRSDDDVRGAAAGVRGRANAAAGRVPPVTRPLPSHSVTPRSPDQLQRVPPDGPALGPFGPFSPICRGTARRTLASRSHHGG